MEPRVQTGKISRLWLVHAMHQTVDSYTTHTAILDGCRFCCVNLSPPKIVRTCHFLACIGQLLAYRCTHSHPHSQGVSNCKKKLLDSPRMQIKKRKCLNDKYSLNGKWSVWTNLFQDYISFYWLSSCAQPVFYIGGLIFLIGCGYKVSCLNHQGKKLETFKIRIALPHD